MNTDQLLQVTSLILVFVSLLLAFFLLTVRSKNKTGNVLLGLYLIINAVDTSSFFYHSFIDVDPTVEMLRIEVGAFFEKPLLFLFILTIIYSDFKLRSRHLLHLTPFLLSSLVLFPRFYLSSYENKIFFFEDHTHTLEGTFSYVLTHLQSIFYIVVVFILLARYKKIFNENYSIASDRTNYTWLFQLNIILTVLFVVATAKNIYKYGDYGEGITEYRLWVAIAILAFTCWLVLKAMYAPKVFRGIDSKLQLVSSSLANSGNKLTVSGERNGDDEKNKQIILLKEHMAKQEPYLNPELTIQDLASQLDIDVRELSLLINHYLNQNFYDFINQYRIDKATQILKNPEQQKLTILEILYQIGFNSKSSFNTSFKKRTGLTPTEYRKRHLK